MKHLLTLHDLVRSQIIVQINMVILNPLEQPTPCLLKHRHIRGNIPETNDISYYYISDTLFGEGILDLALL